MQQTPKSARTKAPASRMYSFPSLKRATVRPADVVPIPVVMTERIEIFEAKLKSYDFPVPGSPIINM